MSRDFGEWMKKRRSKLNMTQVRLAQKVGVHYNTIIQYEQGIRFPTLDMAEVIVVALGGKMMIEERI